MRIAVLIRTKLSINCSQLVTSALQKLFQLVTVLVIIENVRLQLKVYHQSRLFLIQIRKLLNVVSVQSPKGEEEVILSLGLKNQYLYLKLILLKAQTEEWPRFATRMYAEVWKETKYL